MAIHLLMYVYVIDKEFFILLMNLFHLHHWCASPFDHIIWEISKGVLKMTTKARLYPIETPHSIIYVHGHIYERRTSV